MNQSKYFYHIHFLILFLVSIFSFHVYSSQDTSYPCKLEANFSRYYNLQQDSLDSSTLFQDIPQSHRSSYQPIYASSQYKLALYHQSGSVMVDGHRQPVVLEDFDLINQICADNPHYNQNKLRSILLHSSIINQAAMIVKNDQPFCCFQQDIYINPDHFKELANAEQRLHILQKSAQKVMNDKHEREQLKNKQKAEYRKAKKLSNSEKKKVEARHKQEKIDLDKKQKQDQLYLYGKKLAPAAQTVTSTSSKKISSQALPKSKIFEQSLLQAYDQHQVITNKFEQADSSFVQVMQQRSQAFEQSIKNQNVSTQRSKINAQTAGFLQAQGIDTALFEHIEGLPIQHQLTHELVNILDEVAQYAQQHQYEIYQTNLIKYCAQLASLSAQSNIEGNLPQAIDGTNCCHGITHYLEGMVCGVAQAYQQFQTALDYFDGVADTYGNLILQYGVQGSLVAHGLEAIVTAGMIAAPTATIAATSVMIGATAYVMAPLCAQAMIDTVDFGGACITGDWDKVASDLDNFGKFISSKETVARMAELAGGIAMPTPNLNYVVDQVLSLRPVITNVQNASGEMVQSLYLMSKNQLQKVYTQGLALLQRPEFINFNMQCEKNCGSYFFNILPQSHPALAGMEVGILSSSEQVALTSFFAQAEKSVAGNVITSSAPSLASQAVQVIEQEAKSLITEQSPSIIQLLHEVLQHEIAQALQQPIVSIDLTAKITDAKYVELRDLSSQIRQLQDLAKYTNNFKNLENLIPEDICYLNRVHELQSYRAQIKNFLDTHKPYFIHDEQVYFIADIASYHIHAADYYRKDVPKGGHSNYGSNKLAYFKPQVVENGPLGAKDVVFYNSRNANLTKKSTVYPETWSEFVSDLKAIEVMISDKAIIKISQDLKSLEIIGFTTEGLKIRIFYDIANKRIKTHHPFWKET